MLRKPKFIVGSLVILGILVWLGFTAQEWGSNTIGYSNLSQAKVSGKLCSVKGYWIKDKATSLDASRFSFYMEDEDGNISRVIYNNGKPNNFEQASSIVVQGKYVDDGTFEARDILVKCPSKYQSEKADQKKNI
ncbi:MAG: cytochrome c maturation protein CcmE [Chlorobiales bacterium]|nr:cytochrome c maturation protein CcmE [Chlorobiales bacterium]